MSWNWVALHMVGPKHKYFLLVSSECKPKKGTNFRRAQENKNTLQRPYSTKRQEKDVLACVRRGMPSQSRREKHTVGVHLARSRMLKSICAAAKKSDCAARTSDVCLQLPGLKTPRSLRRPGCRSVTQALAMKSWSYHLVPVLGIEKQPRGEPEETRQLFHSPQKLPVFPKEPPNCKPS